MKVGQGVLNQLMLELSERNKAVGAPVGPYMHGPNGLWSYPGLERPVISTRVKPTGLAGRLPARATNVMNPLYPYLTGFTDPAETQPVGVCDDPPTAGQMKNCFQTAVFGRVSYQTRVMDLTRLGQIINRSEFTDFQLWNDPLGQSEGPSGFTIPGSTPGALALNNEANVRFAEVGVKFQNKLNRLLWEGNPANNTAGGGYQEFQGLDTLIGTGKVDAVTGVACPSLNSLVVNSAFKAVDDMTGDNIVEVLTYELRILRDIASRTGLAPVEHAIVMREALFYELTAIWPCSYLTYRCVTQSGAAANVNATDAITMRDEMRNGKYLVVDGVQFPVIVDDALPQLTNADNVSIPVGSYASNIRIVPLTVQGNKAATFWEYFAWNGPNAMLSGEMLGAMPGAGQYYWTDGGQYVWHFKPPVNWCVQWVGLISPRVILLTPHLAGEINNVVYTPLMSPRDAYPDQDNYVNGGATTRATAPALTLST